MSTAKLSSDVWYIKLDEIVKEDPQWPNRSKLALDILWTWVKDQLAKKVIV